MTEEEKELAKESKLLWDLKEKLKPRVFPPNPRDFQGQTFFI